MIVAFCLTPINATKHTTIMSPGSIKVVGMVKKMVRKRFWDCWSWAMVSRPRL
jgi:hypothetical protein